MEWLHFREPVNTWTHLIWMLLAFPATLLLWQRCHGPLSKRWSLLIFGLSLVICFGSSALYHGLPLPPDQLQPFITLDHVGIFLLIAGSCTGIAFSLMHGFAKWLILAVVWSAAVAGITGRLIVVEVPHWLNPCLYVFLGWSLAFSYPRLVQAVSHRPVRWVWLGGLLYTLGALCYLLNWPTLWPGVLGGHEMLHFFDMAGSLAHYWFILKYVVPYERSAGLETALAQPGNQTAPVSV